MTFSLETIITLCLAIAPALTAIIGVITAVVKLIKSGKSNAQEIGEKIDMVRVGYESEIRDLRATCNTLIEQNIQLKQQQAKLLRKISHIMEVEE